jgi:hypothetical protein
MLGSRLQVLLNPTSFTTYPDGHGIVFDFAGVNHSSLTTSAFNTEASPAAILVYEGRGVIGDFATQVTNDNYANGTYTTLTTPEPYSNFPDSGTQILYKLAPSGGAGFAVTSTKPSIGDEATFIAVAVPTGFGTIQDWKWNEAAGPVNTSLSVTTTGPAWLYCFTAGLDTSGWLNPTASAGWIPLEHTSSVSSNTIQSASFAKYVSSAGSYNCVQTPDVPQASQMWIIAMQAP